MRNIVRNKVILFIGILLILVVYLIGVLYFESHFFPNTYAGPVNISQTDHAGGQQKFTQDIGDYVISFTEKDGDVGSVSGAEIAIQGDISQVLAQELEEQNSIFWFFYLFQKKKTIDIMNQLEINPEPVSTLLSKLGVENSQRQPTEDAFVEKDEGNEFFIEPEVYGNQITEDSLIQTLRKYLSQGESVVPLEEAYVKPNEKEDSDSILQRREKVNQMIATKITLKFDDQAITIPEDQIKSWIYFDEDNQPRIDVEEVDAYIYGLNEEYAALFQYRLFASTYQGEVTVQPGTYGWYIDRHVEAPQIAEEIENTQSVEREVAIGGTGYGLENDIGYSYVEVDLTYQMMFIYHEGQLVYETPIVSGKIGTDTVPGAYQVWSMEENANLRGYNPNTERDYIQPVSYWIAFDDQAQGIHDANWQSNFGGTVYQQYGSLGCINTPPNAMAEVFQLVYYGMPVIVFH